MSITRNVLNEKINVIYIIGKFGIGGIETLIYKIAKNLDRRFFSPTIIALNDYIDKNAEDQIISSLRKDNIEVLKLSGSIKNSRLKKILFIRKHLKGRKNVVIHSNSDIVNTVMATWKMKIFLVNTYHSVTGWNKKDRIVYKIFMQKRFKKIVAVSNAVKQAIEKAIGIEESKIEVIYNGIEIEKFKQNTPTTKKSPNNLKVVNLLFVGRLSYEKSSQTLLESLKYLNFENVRLSIVGDGSLLKELREFVVKNNLDEKVVFLGAVNNDDIPQILWNADVYVMPSLYEGFSVSLIEAMASGKPLVLSNIDPFKEALDAYNLNFSNGFAITKFGTIFEVGNSLALANALNWMIENKEKWSEFGKNSYERAKNFDISKTVEEYEHVYKEIIKS